MFRPLPVFYDMISSARVPERSKKILIRWLSFSIEEIIGKKNVISIYVVGSLARGDFIAINHGVWYPISDFDFLFIINRLSEKITKVSLLAEKISPMISPSNKLFHIGLKIRHPSELEHLHPLYLHDWDTFGLCIFGKENKMSSLSCCSPTLLSVIGLRMWYCCLYAPIWLAAENIKGKISLDFVKFSYVVARVGVDVSRCLQINPEQGNLLTENEMYRIKILKAKIEKFKQNTYMRPILDLCEIYNTLIFMFQIGNRLLIHDKKKINNIIYQSIFRCGQHLIEWVQDQNKTKYFLKNRTLTAIKVLKSNNYQLRDHKFHYSRICDLTFS